MPPRTSWRSPSSAAINLVRLEDVEEPQDEGDLEGDEVWSD